jgi:hypothetical protein
MADLAVEAKMIRRCPLDQSMAFTPEAGRVWICNAFGQQLRELGSVEGDKNYLWALRRRRSPPRSRKVNVN